MTIKAKIRTGCKAFVPATSTVECDRVQIHVCCVLYVTYNDRRDGILSPETMPELYT